jgi:hypothetical protein
MQKWIPTLYIFYCVESIPLLAFASPKTSCYHEDMLSFSVISRPGVTDFCTFLSCALKKAHLSILFILKYSFVRKESQEMSQRMFIVCRGMTNTEVYGKFRMPLMHSSFVKVFLFSAIFKRGQERKVVTNKRSENAIKYETVTRPRYKIYLFCTNESISKM